jgi:hypothetical protein
MKLVRRANGVYYIYFDRLTKKSLKTKDKEEAVRLFNTEKELIRRGKIVELDKIKYIKLSELKADYLATRELNVTRATKDNDELAFEKWIAVCGDVSARKIDRDAIDEFKANLLSLGNSKAYINILLRCLRAAFYWAKDKGYISDKPFRQEAWSSSGVV